MDTLWQQRRNDHSTWMTAQDKMVRFLIYSELFWKAAIHLSICRSFSFGVCSDWLYSAITYSPITTSLSGQIRLKSIVTLVTVEHFKCKKIPYPTEAEMVGHSQFIHKILCTVAVWLPGKGWRNPEDSHYSLPLRMIRIIFFWLNYSLRGSDVPRKAFFVEERLVWTKWNQFNSKDSSSVPEQLSTKHCPLLKN